MLTRSQLNRYADVLLWALHTARRHAFKKGDIVLIRFHHAALILAEILHERLLAAGMHPLLHLNPTPRMEKDLFDLGSAKQLSFLWPGEQALNTALNGSIFLYAPDSLTHLRNVDPKKPGRYALARKPLKNILDQRDAQGSFGWTLGILPTEAQARHAKTTLAQYTEQVVKACHLQRRDPVSHWRMLHQNVQELTRWLSAITADTIHIESDHIDLTITPGAQRRWIGLSGHNIPSFELFLSPDWRGTEGIYFANLPSYRSGNRVRDVRLEFHKGEVVTLTAREGEAFTRQQLAMDAGARRVGEFSLTDKRFSRIDRFMANTLFDENYGGAYGNCHIALGSSYADTYALPASELTPKHKRQLGFNDSALHWDLINTEKKRVTASLRDGRKVVIYENGLFQY